ncbi:MAG: hypothetical protein LBK58_08040 [Prevotellaceae bacterium]|jgi:hypothetical protein|nr:hypothetical protein [Prevotellaceae bacterium]
MNALTDREKWDIRKIAGDRDYYPSLPEHRKTAAVSTVAVLACGHNLEYVPETVINKEICRAALNSKNVDCTVLPHIPYPDVQKEGIQKFISSGTPAFVVYSFADIRDAKTAREAVKADAYCLQLVPDKLLTAELCKMALQSPNADKKVLDFISEKFRTPEIRKAAEAKFGNSREQKKPPPPQKRMGTGL